MVTGVNGCAVTNDTVKATSNDTSIATVSPSKVKTDANGKVTVKCGEVSKSDSYQVSIVSIQALANS